MKMVPKNSSFRAHDGKIGANYSKYSYKNHIEFVRQELKIKIK